MTRPCSSPWPPGNNFICFGKLYGTLFVPQEVWNAVTLVDKPLGPNEARQAREDGWLIIRNPASPDAVRALPFNLQRDEIQALALAVELPDSLLLVDDVQGRRAAQALGIRYTGTLGVLLRAKTERKLPALDFPCQWRVTVSIGPVAGARGSK